MSDKPQLISNDNKISMKELFGDSWLGDSDAITVFCATCGAGMNGKEGDIYFICHCCKDGKQEVNKVLTKIEQGLST